MYNSQQSHKEHIGYEKQCPSIPYANMVIVRTMSRMRIEISIIGIPVIRLNGSKIKQLRGKVARDTLIVVIRIR
jgi:hypothetical protein